MIIKKNYSRKDYEETLLKVLNKCKVRYLAEKKNDCGTPVEKLQVTDEDLIPFELLDSVLTEMEHKHSEKIQSYHEFIKECHSVIQLKITKLNIDAEKTKKIVEQNVLATYLNQVTE